MIVGLISNWSHRACGVAQFGRNWAAALEAAGHDVRRLGWNDPKAAQVDRVLLNWDSGTLPHDAVPSGSIVFVHHTYRGIPYGLHEATLLSPIQGYGIYWPYPVPTYRAVDPVVQPRTLGVTTLRKEGLDYLEAACAEVGWTVCPSTRWRETSEEIDRLSTCAACALWYTSSPGRSLALATSLAAARPLLLSCSRMFEYAGQSEDVYWVPYSNQDLSVLRHTLRQIDLDMERGVAKIPHTLATEWSWPTAIHALERLWT